MPSKRLAQPPHEADAFLFHMRQHALLLDGATHQRVRDQPAFSF